MGSLSVRAARDYANQSSSFLDTSPLGRGPQTAPAFHVIRAGLARSLRSRTPRILGILFFKCASDQHTHPLAIEQLQDWGGQILRAAGESLSRRNWKPEGSGERCNADENKALGSFCQLFTSNQKPVTLSGPVTDSLRWGTMFGCLRARRVAPPTFQ